MSEVEETNTRDLNGNVGCLKGCSRRELGIKCRSGTGDLCSERASVSNATRGGDFCDHRFALIVLENQMVVRIARRSAFQFVVRQSGVDDKYCVLGGVEAAVRWDRTWRCQTNQLCDGCILWTGQTNASSACINAG